MKVLRLCGRGPSLDPLALECSCVLGTQPTLRGWVTEVGMGSGGGQTPGSGAIVRFRCRRLKGRRRPEAGFSKPGRGQCFSDCHQAVPAQQSACLAAPGQTSWSARRWTRARSEAGIPARHGWRSYIVKLLCCCAGCSLCMLSKRLEPEVNRTASLNPGDGDSRGGVAAASTAVQVLRAERWRPRHPQSQGRDASRPKSRHR